MQSWWLILQNMAIFSKIGGNWWITFVAITLPISGVRRSYLDSEALSPIPFRNMPFKTQKQKNVDPKQTVSGTRQATGPLLASSLRAGGAGAGAGGGHWWLWLLVFVSVMFHSSLGCTRPRQFWVCVEFGSSGWASHWAGRMSGQRGRSPLAWTGRVCLLGGQREGHSVGK